MPYVRKYTLMCQSNFIPLVPSPEPWGFVWVGQVTNTDLKKKKKKKSKEKRVAKKLNK